MSINLTARSVETLKPRPERFIVRDAQVSGLELRVHPDGAKVWTLRYRINRQQRRLKLGTYRTAGQGSGTSPRMGLASARDAATKALRKVDVGIDPQAERHEAQQAAEQAKRNDIEALCESYITRYAKPRKRTWKDDDRLLRAEVLPAWRHRPVTEITRRDVRVLVQAIADRGAPILANRVAALVSKVFKFAMDEDVIDTSPAFRIPRPGQERERTRVLSDGEICLLWAKLDALEDPQMGAFYKLRLLTAQRGGEVCTMRWSDLDLDGGWWTIPAERSKNKLPHRVPLAPAVLKLLETLKPAPKPQTVPPQKEPTAGPVFVLAGARGKRQQSEAAATFGIPDFRGHDLRRTAASRMAAAAFRDSSSGRF